MNFSHRVLIAGAVSLTAFAFSETQPPNIIFLLSDDQSTLSVGCYGNKEVQTPNIDRLGADGIIFDPRSQTAGKKLRCGSLTGNIDVAPTILELAGRRVPENIDGKSLLPLIADPNTDIREHMALINT